MNAIKNTLAMICVVILVLVSTAGCLNFGDTDTDGDGISDIEEVSYGSDPNDADSTPLSVTDWVWYKLSGLDINIKCEGQQTVIEHYPNYATNNVTGEYIITTTITGNVDSVTKEGSDTSMLKHMPKAPPQSVNEHYFREYSPIYDGVQNGFDTWKSQIFGGLPMLYNESSLPGDWLYFPEKQRYIEDGVVKERYDLDNYTTITDDTRFPGITAKKPNDDRAGSDLVKNNLEKAFCTIENKVLTEASKHQYEWTGIYIHVTLKNPWTGSIFNDFKMALMFPIHIPFDPDDGNAQKETNYEAKVNIFVPFPDIAKKWFAVSVQGSKIPVKCFVHTPRDILYDFISEVASGGIGGLIAGILIVALGVITANPMVVIIGALILGCVIGAIFYILKADIFGSAPADYDDHDLTFYNNADDLEPFGEEVVVFEG